MRAALAWVLTPQSARKQLAVVLGILAASVVVRFAWNGWAATVEMLASLANAAHPRPTFFNARLARCPPGCASDSSVFSWCRSPDLNRGQRAYEARALTD